MSIPPGSARLVSRGVQLDMNPPSDTLYQLRTHVLRLRMNLDVISAPSHEDSAQSEHPLYLSPACVDSTGARHLVDDAYRWTVGPSLIAENL